MKNLCFRVITMVIGLYFTGTMTNPSRKSSILFNSKYQWNGYLTTNCSFAGKHEIPMDIPQMAPTVDDSFNFLRVLLQTHMKKEEWNIKHLDLSNNLISKITLSSLEHFHALETLNLSNNAIHSVLLDLPSFKSSWVKRHRGSLRNRLPFLKLLTLQRNKLSNIPKGKYNFKRWTKKPRVFGEVICLLSCSVTSDPSDTFDCTQPGSSVHGIFQARILEWITIYFSRESSWPRDQTCVSYVSCIIGRFFTYWVIMFCVNKNSRFVFSFRKTAASTAIWSE